MCILGGHPLNLLHELIRELRAAGLAFARSDRVRNRALIEIEAMRKSDRSCGTAARLCCLRRVSDCKR